MGAELVFFSDDEEERLTTLAAMLGEKPHDAVIQAVDFYATVLQGQPGDILRVTRLDRPDEPERRYMVLTPELQAHMQAVSIVRYIGVILSLAFVWVALMYGLGESIDDGDWIGCGLAALAMFASGLLWRRLYQFHRPEPRRQREPHQKAPKPDPGE